MPFKIYNSLSRKIEEFKPVNPPNVSLYTCGPTVYLFAHIGHLRKYTNDDLLRRVISANGYKVKHVQNITDVGHLVSDADTGEDKMEKGAKSVGKTVWEVAKFYEAQFFDSLKKMNILMPDVICRATEHIDIQINLIQKLFDKGFAYETDEAVYFDVTKFPSYGALSGQKLTEKMTGARADVHLDPNKKNPTDFVLWFKRVGHFANHQMHWDSPWGDGFPGWHIECSAMSMKYLGETIDIHTGGIDHIPVHHENEIAQSEAATGKKFVNYWVHWEFLVVDNTKMSKSLDNFYTLDDITKKGFSSMALRYLFLTTHYKQKLNFTWEALEGAQNSWNNLNRLILEKKEKVDSGVGSKDPLVTQFYADINNDLNMPKALATMWEMVKSEQGTFASIMLADKVLGLELGTVENRTVPKEVLDLSVKRDDLRSQGKFEEADKMRRKISELGFEVEDTPDGTRII